MELQQHTNLKSVNIKQFIQCNKNAVYMRPIRYRYAYSDDYISCYPYNIVDLCRAISFKSPFLTAKLEM